MVAKFSPGTRVPTFLSGAAGSTTVGTGVSLNFLSTSTLINIRIFSIMLMSWLLDLRLAKLYHLVARCSILMLMMLYPHANADAVADADTDDAVSSC